MDINQVVKTISKLQQEATTFHLKKVKAKRNAIILLVVGIILLIPFIVFMCITFNDVNFKGGIPLIIVFGVLSLITLEGSILFFVFSKCVYAYQEENRKKLLEYINKEINKSKNK